MADNTAITPGSGETIADDDIGGVKYQRNKLVYGDDGVNTGDVSIRNPYPVTDQTRDTYVIQTGPTSLVATASTIHLDLFNATGSGVVLRVVGLYHNFRFPGTVTGVDVQWDIIRTSTVGTGGSIVAPQSLDTNNIALPATVTARIKPTAGATTSSTLWTWFTYTEDSSNAYEGIWTNGVNLLYRPLIIRETQGLKLTQTTSSATGTCNTTIFFERAPGI